MKLYQQYGTLLWQSSNFTSTIRNTTLAILKLYLNNTEHSSGNPQTLPQQYETLLWQSLNFTSTIRNTTLSILNNTLPQQYGTLLWQS